jgi:hypothetical protein
MPKINVEIAETLPEPMEGHIYTITETELFTSQVRGYKGLRVAMTDQESGNQVVAALWMREIAGSKSKLGSFISVLGDESDSWVGKQIKFVTWRPNDRKIEVIQ